MATTKAILVERCRRLISAGFPSVYDRVRDPEIAAAIATVTNKMLAVSVLGTTFNVDGDSIPEGSVIATYTNIPVTAGPVITQANGENPINSSIAKLPATPMYLPDRMGLFSVYPSGRPWNEYIPLPPGVYHQWMRDKLVSTVNRNLYEWSSGYVTVFDDLPGSGITKLDMKLCIMDISLMDANDPLPLPPEMEGEVIAAVVAMFRQEPANRRTESPQPEPVA